MERGKKRVVDSQLESVHLVRMNHLNSAGRLFGGQLMQWIDETAAMAAKRHAHRPIITASFNNLQFLRGAYREIRSCSRQRLSMQDIHLWMSKWRLMQRR